MCLTRFFVATKEECKTDYTNCKSEENKECFSTHVQFEGKPEPIQLCECKAGFKRADGNTCELGKSFLQFTKPSFVNKRVLQKHIFLTRYSIK